MQQGDTTTSALIEPPPTARSHQKNSLTFDQLKDGLHELFSGDSVNVEELNELLAAYRSDPREWKKYAKFDRFK
jgi:Cysteine dioxygenase type I